MNRSSGENNDFLAVHEWHGEAAVGLVAQPMGDEDRPS
jgi:hypothetical protein